MVLFCYGFGSYTRNPNHISQFTQLFYLFLFRCARKTKLNFLNVEDSFYHFGNKNVHLNVCTMRIINAHVLEFVLKKINSFRGKNA